MNIELLETIRDWLLSQKPTPDGFEFDMDIWIVVETTPEGWCGTACCLAGAALAFGDPDSLNSILMHEIAGYGASQPFWYSDPVSNLAADLLGLTPEQADELFIPDDPLNVTHEQAAATINHLIKTGEVLWIFPKN